MLLYYFFYLSPLAYHLPLVAFGFPCELCSQLVVYSYCFSLCSICGTKPSVISFLIRVQPRGCIKTAWSDFDQIGMSSCHFRMSPEKRRREGCNPINLLFGCFGLGSFLNRKKNFLCTRFGKNCSIA